MTAQQIAAMGDRQLNREIARICEWKLDDFDSGIHPRGGPVVQFIPDYCRDLNAAMGIVPEWNKSPTDADVFGLWLFRAVQGRDPDPEEINTPYWQAWGEDVPHALKPRKLAEAFLLWKAGGR